MALTLTVFFMQKIYFWFMKSDDEKSKYSLNRLALQQGFEISRCPAYVTGYFKHLRRIPFPFQILLILFHQSDIFQEINER